MKQLILVRYGQYDNGHLTDEGVNTMTLAGSILKPLISNLTVRVVAAETRRAIESAEIVGSMINKKVESYSQLYAAEEEGRLPDCETAKKLLLELGDGYDCVVAIVSREYIETLPSYLLNKELQTSLDRGECLVIDLEHKSITFLK